MPRHLDHRHLHAEADAEVGHLALAREAGRLDLALRAALAEAARHQDAVHALEVVDGVVPLEDLGIDPVHIDAHVIGDAAMRKRLGERLVGVEQMRVFADHRDRHLAFGLADALDDALPAREVGLALLPDAEMLDDLGVETLGVVAQRAPRRWWRRRGPG